MQKNTATSPILYAKNKEGWESVERIAENNQTYVEGISVHRKKTI